MIQTSRRIAAAFDAGGRPQGVTPVNTIDAARILGVTTRTVYNMLRDGRLHYQPRRPGKPRIDEASPALVAAGRRARRGAGSGDGRKDGTCEPRY